MKANRRGRKIASVVIAVCLLLAAGIVYRYRVVERIRFNAQERRNAKEWKSRSLWLPEYHVAVEAAPVDGITRNLSGLTWNGETKTLFAVTNSPEEVVELSTTGRLLRRITLHGFDDTEAIEYIGDNRYVIADEEMQRLRCVAIDAETKDIHAEGYQCFSIGSFPTGNLGLEGLAWDPSDQKLYAAKEWSPIRIHEVSGLSTMSGPAQAIEVTGNPDRDARLFMASLSGLHFNRKYRHLLVVSAASRLVLEIDGNGMPVSSLSLLMGNGLTRPVPQAEGITMDDENNLYLVSEPNLFYVFRKKDENPNS